MAVVAGRNVCSVMFSGQSRLISDRTGLICLGLIQYPDIHKYDLSALKVGLVATAPTSAELQKRLHSTLGFPFIQGYGLTETSPAANFRYMEPRRIGYGSVGPSGWLHTRDIVRMDQDGYVWILDRKKELIKCKGFQVPPAELEGLLLEHPAVADAAVIGKADLEAGEIPKAFIVRQTGTEVSAGDIMGFVTRRVATFKNIREVEFVDSIPKNASGKILRRVLIEQERAKAR